MTPDDYDDAPVAAVEWDLALDELAGKLTEQRLNKYKQQGAPGAS